MKQTRKQKTELYQSIESQLVPLVSKPIDELAHDYVYSGDVAATLLAAFTYDHMELEWDIEDERRLLLTEVLKNDGKKSDKAIESVADIWGQRLQEQKIKFDFQEQESLEILDRCIRNMGRYIGVDTDIEALFEGVPSYDILA